MRGSPRLALPLSAVSFAFSVLALPLVYVAVPFCSPTATAADLITTVGAPALASALALGGVLLSLLSVYTTRSPRDRLSLALSTSALAIATAFIIFGIALRECLT